jgi:hypothetical protein
LKNRGTKELVNFCIFKFRSILLLFAQASSTIEVCGTRILATMGLDFRLPIPIKIAVGLLTLQKWRPFENYLTPVKNAHISDQRSLLIGLGQSYHQFKWSGSSFEQNI